MEHHSNIVPWQLLCEEQGARLEYLRVDGQGRLDLAELDERLAGGRVRLVAVTHVSNVLGTINPVAEISERAHAAGALVLLDGAQAVPQMPVDVNETGADFYAFTGHKMLGPTGIGVLWARRELLEEMPPFLGGGSMIKAVEDDHSTWAAVPAKFEAGTPAIAEGVGLGAAADYLQALGMDAVRAHEREVTAYALERIAALDGVTVYGPRDAAERGSLVSFAVEGIHPHDLAELCNREAVCDPRRPPLRAAADAAPGRARHSAGLVLGLQHDRRSGPADRRAGEREEGLRRLMDQLYREFILDHYKTPAQLRRARAARRRVRGPQPALRRRDGRPHQARRRPDRGPALPRHRAARSRRRPPRSSRTS